MDGGSGLTLAIVIGGYVALFIYTEWMKRRDADESHISASEKRIRRELSRHSKETGNDD